MATSGPGAGTETCRSRTDAFNGTEQYDSWVHLLNRTYGGWDVPVHPKKRFSARLKKTNFGNFGVTECVCDPCGGTRNQSHIDRDDREMLVIQLTQRGRERIRFEDEDYALGPGDIMIWDSTRRMMFSVEERLDKVSLMLPLQRVQSWLPGSWQSVPRKIPAQSADAVLLSSYIRALTTSDLGSTPINGECLAEAAVALLAAVVDRESGLDKASLRSRQLEQIQSFIKQNLADNELTLARIAEVNDISLRYLHWLFQSTDETAARYLQRQRLSRCHRDLQNPMMKRRRIADIAESWGFNDPMHFSRIFKDAYGATPSAVRKQRDAAAAKT